MEYLSINIPTTGNVRQVEEEPSKSVQVLTNRDRDSLDNLTKLVQELTKQ